MDDHNSVRITGWLARDAELRYSQSGTPMTFLNVDVASGEGYSRRHCWIDVKVFGEQARRFEGATKGARVSVLAKLVQDSWEDKQTGQKRNKHALHADAAFLIAEAKDKAEKDDGERKAPAKKKAAAPAEEVVDYGDIPF